MKRQSIEGFVDHVPQLYKDVMPLICHHILLLQDIPTLIVIGQLTKTSIHWLNDYITKQCLNLESNINRFMDVLDQVNSARMGCYRAVTDSCLRKYIKDYDTISDPSVYMAYTYYNSLSQREWKIVIPSDSCDCRLFLKELHHNGIHYRWLWFKEGMQDDYNTRWKTGMKVKTRLEITSSPIYHILFPLCY